MGFDLIALVFMWLAYSYTSQQAQNLPKKEVKSCCMRIPSRLAGGIDTPANFRQYKTDPTNAGMVLISGGIFSMGGDNRQASPDAF